MIYGIVLETTHAKEWRCFPNHHSLCFHFDNLIIYLIFFHLKIFIFQSDCHPAHKGKDFLKFLLIFLILNIYADWNAFSENKQKKET